MSSHAELRLVVLGRTGAGKRSAVCAILGLDSEQDADGPGPQESRKHRGQAAGRQVAVVSGPPWFGSGCDPQQRRRHLSALVALSSPGPHAFLLCVPVNRPADEEAEALAVLGRLFGASAVSKHTVVLFTHTEELEEDEQLDDYLAAWRHDLQELLQRCGGRHHTLEARAGAPGGAGAVEELLEKVERALQESGEPHLRCLLYQQTEQRVREKQVELARGKAGGAATEELPEQLLEEVRDEAERSVGDLDLDVDAIFPSGAAGPAGEPSLARRLWGLLTGWTQWLPTLVRRESLLGALVGLFVGGPFGGVVGATVGSVATEVGRRKTEKTK
ncbi:GTPase IMAP family member 9 isoform X2 [Betta splendens]|uniref:GTPase IMAP family member 9 isoform X2 n=1 Tax=Betta splendens TaxID=158456 RepID=A0A9W2XYQ0_BETSP|nr:GTPase IMAP family member 9 isoform X2 [Betta splendens]